MNYLKDGVVGILGIIFTGISMESLSGWVSLICSLAIAIATCGIQIYRMIRDRDRDKEKEIEEKQKEE